MADGSAARPLPPFHELTAPAHWRTVDFISDLHLAEEMPATFAAFARHLRETPAQAVIILGDLFEVWVGDDARARPFPRLVINAIAEGASRRQIGVMVGNRDFLLGTALLRECGAFGMPDPTVLSIGGQRLLLTHGDALCLADTPYQEFRQMVRGEAWRQGFLAKPLAERLRIAAEIRQASESRRRYDGSADADVDGAEAVRWMHTQGAAEMVHGHTHRPGSAPLAPGFKRHVLSDWDLDRGSPRAEVLRLTRDGFARVAPAGAPAR